MAILDKKRIERAMLDWARQVSSVFPEEDPVEGERPDFVWPAHGIGLDITEVRQPADQRDGLRPAAKESFREKVTRSAERQYAAAGFPAVDVAIALKEIGVPTGHPDRLGQEISTFVMVHPPTDGVTRNYYAGDLSDPIPEGITCLGISPARDLQAPRWQGFQSGRTILLTFEMLAAVIASKESKVSEYRKNAPRVWLLTICGQFPGSASIAVPNDIGGWVIPSSFDRVFLYSRHDKRVDEIEIDRRSG